MEAGRETLGVGIDSWSLNFCRGPCGTFKSTNWRVGVIVEGKAFGPRHPKWVPKHNQELLVNVEPEVRPEHYQV